MKLFGLDIRKARPDRPPGTIVTQTLDTQSMLAAFNPDGTPFSPGVPLPPTITEIEPRGWAPPIGWNLIYNNTKRPGARHEVLRTFADNCPPLRIVIEQLKRELRGVAVTIARSDGEEVEDSPTLRDLRAWLKRPDGRILWSDWVNAVLEDVLVIGAASLGRLRRADGTVAGLRVIDASAIVPIVTSAGLTPDPPAPAYYFNAYGLPLREYTADELIYRPFNRRSWTPYGYSPVEQVLLYAMLATNRALYYTNWYTDGNVPPGFMKTPEGWSPAKIGEFQEYIDTLMDSNTSQRHKALAVPNDFDYQQARSDAAWQYDFDEFLLRAFCWALGVSAAPIVKQSSLGQGTEGLSDEAVAGGLAPYQQFVEELLDDYVQNVDVGLTTQDEPIPLGLGQPDYEFAFVSERSENRTEKLAEDTELAKIGARTLNEIRTSRGEEPYDEGEYPSANVPMVLTQSGFVPLAPVSLSVEPAGDVEPLATGGAPLPGGVEAAQDTALNGAQVTAAVGIVSEVAAGRLPRDAGVSMLQAFFNLTLEQAEEIMGTVGSTFVPNEPAPIQPVMAESEGDESEDDEQESEDDESTKAELARWRRKATRDLKAGRQLRPFASSVIAPAVRAHVEAHLERGDLAGAFDLTKLDRKQIRTYATSSAARLVEAQSAPVFQKLLEKIAAHYAAQAEAALAASKE